MKKLFLLLCLTAIFSCKNSDDNHSEQTEHTEQNNGTTESSNSSDNASKAEGPSGTWLDPKTQEVMLFTNDKVYWAKKAQDKMVELGVKSKEEGKISVYFKNKPNTVYDMLFSSTAESMECRLDGKKLNDYQYQSDNTNPSKIAEILNKKGGENKPKATHPVIGQIRPAKVPMRIDQGANSMQKLSKIYTKLYKEDIKQLFPNFKYTTDGEGNKIESVVFFQVFLDDNDRRLLGAFQSDYQQAQGGMGGGGSMGTMFRDLLFLQMVEADGTPIGKPLTPILLEDKRGQTYDAAEAIITKKEISIKTRPYTQNGEPEEGGYVEESKILITPTGLKWK